MLNIKINKIQKMGDFFGFGGGSRKPEALPRTERSEMRNDLKIAENLWRGDIQPADIEFIKAKQQEILNNVEESRNSKLTQVDITNLGIQKMKLIRERDAEANKISNQKEKDALAKEIGAHFNAIN